MFEDQAQVPPPCRRHPHDRRDRAETTTSRCLQHCHAHIRRRHSRRTLRRRPYYDQVGRINVALQTLGACSLQPAAYSLQPCACLQLPPLLPKVGSRPQPPLSKPTRWLLPVRARPCPAGVRGVSILGSSGDGGSHWSFMEFPSRQPIGAALNKVGHDPPTSGGAAAASAARRQC